MTDSRFEELLAEAIQEYGGDYIEVPEEMWKPHRFSRAFEKRMRKILQKERRTHQQERGTYLPRRRIPLRLLIAVLVSFLVAIAAVTTVGAFREAIVGFVVNEQDVFANIRADADVDAPETLETLYEMTWVPEGYEVTKEVHLDILNYVHYENNEDDYISFSQSTLVDFIANYDNENLDIVDARIGSYDGLWMKGDSDAIFVWKMDDYIFEIIAVGDRHIDEEVVHKMVESVKKADS